MTTSLFNGIKPTNVTEDDSPLPLRLCCYIVYYAHFLDTAEADVVDRAANDLPVEPRATGNSTKTQKGQTLTTGWPSGRGTLFVDIKLKDPPHYKLLTIKCSSYFIVNKGLSSTRWTNLYERHHLLAWGGVEQCSALKASRVLFHKIGSPGEPH